MPMTQGKAKVKRCLLCLKNRPFYLFESHVKKCREQSELIKNDLHARYGFTTPQMILDVLRAV